MLNENRKWDEESIDGYRVEIELINHDVITFTATNQEFIKLRNWYEDDTQGSYLIKEPLKSTNIHRSNVINFSYTEIKNNDTSITRILNLLMRSTSRKNLFMYLQLLLLVLLGTVMFSLMHMLLMNTQNVSFTNFDLNSFQAAWTNIKANFILFTFISLLSFYFIFLYFITFVMLFIQMIGPKKDEGEYRTKAKKQRVNIFWKYAIIHLIIIFIVQEILISILS